MIRRPPRSTRTDTLFPYTTLFRSAGEFDAALATGSEEAMQNIIETHPYLLQYAFRTTGHHGTWAYAKRWIRTNQVRSEEHTSELQSLMRISYAVFCLKKKTHKSDDYANATGLSEDIIKLIKS